MRKVNAQSEVSRARKYRINVRMNEAEKAAFDAGIASAGLSQAEYLRRRATLKPIVAKGFLELRAEVLSLGGEVRRFGGLVKHLASMPKNAEIRHELNGIWEMLNKLNGSVLALHKQLSQTPTQELGVEE